MSLPPKSHSTAASHLLVLYSKMLHPEFLNRRVWETFRCAAGELEVWLLPGGHVLTFSHKGSTLCEIVTDHENKSLPDGGILGTFPCMAERDFEHEAAKTGVRYMTSVFTDSLSDSIYDTELEDIAREGVRNPEILRYEWTDDGGRCLSQVMFSKRTQRREGRVIHEAQADCVHCVAALGVVVRTSTIFECPS